MCINPINFTGSKNLPIHNSDFFAVTQRREFNFPSYIASLVRRLAVDNGGMILHSSFFNI